MERYALISVSDKSGLIEFSKKLVSQYHYNVLSTGGTAKFLKDHGIQVVDVSDYTGFPEMMDGRVKTLHPKVHGGILCRRDKPEHVEQAEAFDIAMIDLVVVNLYPFESTVSHPDCTFEEAIEHIDIGGPSMLRSAAKNWESVTVICDPTDYKRVLNACEKVSSEKGDNTSAEENLRALRKQLALKVFKRTSAYDLAIAQYLENQQDEPNLDAILGFPEVLNLSYKRAKILRYGENPHQTAALYGRFFDCYEQFHGKELSYNNILDIHAATYLIGEFEKPTVAILKHTNPCGVASGDTILKAWHDAFETDTQAPFGGIIIANRTIDESMAEAIAEIFSEVVIAPAFSDDARSILMQKKNLRLMFAKESPGVESLQVLRSIIGGILLQDRDLKKENPASYQVVTNRQPTEEEWASMLFGWRVVKHVKSNAIVCARGERTLGVGAGQMSRVTSSRIAIEKAIEAGFQLEKAIIASDAFFPFADGLVSAAKVGVSAAIQPGGSVRDEEVIQAANDHNMTMVFTGTRHFLH